MYYKHKHDHRYQLLSITSGYSKVKKTKGWAMTTIVFHNLDLEKSLETYVMITGQNTEGTWLDGYENRFHWEEIIDNFDVMKDYIITFKEKMRDQHGNTPDFKVKLKHEKGAVKYILNADSIPDLDAPVMKLSTFEPVEEEVQEEPVKQFDNPLFGIV